MAPPETIVVPPSRFSRTRDMPEFRCCLFGIVRLNLIDAALPREVPCTGKKRFLVPVCVLSLCLTPPLRFAASSTLLVCSQVRLGAAAAAAAAIGRCRSPASSMVCRAATRRRRERLAPCARDWVLAHLHAWRDSLHRRPTPHAQ